MPDSVTLIDLFSTKALVNHKLKWYACPRWLRAPLLSRTGNSGVVGDASFTVAGGEERWVAGGPVRLIRCDGCQDEYAVWADGRERIACCRPCRQAKQAQQRRRRRRQARQDKLQKTCQECGILLAPERTTAMYCGSGCRVKAWRAARRRK
jgi:hypothetical protein